MLSYLNLIFMALKNKILFTLLFIQLFQHQSIAQYRQLRLAKEELEKNNFDKVRVYEKIKKYEKDEGLKPESKYIRSKYLIKTSEDLVVLDSAYTYFSDAFTDLEYYDQKKKEELCKEIVFCESNKTLENNELELFLFTKYTREKNIDIIESFITKYSKSVFAYQAIRLRDSLEYEKLKPLNDETVLKEFLLKRPNSVFYIAAEDLMYTIAFDKTKASNSVIKYKEYLNKYPNSPFYKEAQGFLSEKDWVEIESSNNKELYQRHTKEFPNSKYSKIANQKIEDIDWKATLEADNLNDFEKFVAIYPGSSKNEIANQKIKEYKELVLPYLNRNKKYTLLNIGTLKFIGDNEYDKMVAYPKNKFIVSKYNKYGVIDSSGNKIIPVTYDCIQNSGDFFIIKLGNNYGVLNDQGQKIIDFAFEYISKTENNRFIITKNINNVKSTYGLISSTGEGLLDAIYSNISEINSSTYNVTLAGQSYLIDENGVLKSQKYTSITPLSYENTPNLLFIAELKNKKGIINAKGEVVIPLIYDAILEAGDYLIVSSSLPKSASLSGIIDLNGRFLVAPKYKNIIHCGKDLFAFNTNTLSKSSAENYKLYSISKNDFITKESFDSIGMLNNDLIQVIKNELVGYINDRGETIVSPIYQMYYGEEGGDGDEGDESCFIDSNYEEDITNFIIEKKSELTLVELSNKFGYINKKGEIIIPIIFTYCSEFYKGLASVSDDERNSIIDEKGKVILENAQILYYFNNSNYALAKQENSYYKIDVNTHELTSYNLLSEMEYITHYKKYKIIDYKGVKVYVTNKNEILMAKGIDFSDYNFNKKVEEASNLYYSANYDDAISQLKTLFNEKNNVYDVPLLIGRCYVAKKETYNAIEYFNQAVSIDPNNSEAYWDRYSLNFERKYWEDAKIDIIKLMNLNSEYNESLTFNLAYCYSELNYNSEAFENYSKVLRNNPKYSLAYNNRGVLYGIKGEHQLALNDYKNALKNCKYDSDELKGLYLNNAGSESFKLNKNFEACEYWSKGASLGNNGCKQNKLYKCR